jgi:hypothetical protein
VEITIKSVTKITLLIALSIAVLIDEFGILESTKGISKLFFLKAFKSQLYSHYFV